VYVLRLNRLGGESGFQIHGNWYNSPFYTSYLLYDSSLQHDVDRIPSPFQINCYEKGVHRKRLETEKN
jgi:hypothetical protein